MSATPSPAPGVPVTSRAALPPLHPLGRGTLSRRLVIRVAAIVALVALVLGLVSTLAVRQIMIAQLDDQLDAALSREESSRDDKYDDDRDDHPVGVFLPGMRIGTIILESAVDNAWRISQVSEGTPNRLDESVARDLLQVPLDGEKHTITVGSLGTFRAEAIDSDRGQVVVALPMADVAHALARLIGLEIVLTLVALAAAAAIVRAIVVSTLRPLNRLAATAAEVSTLELDRGEVALPMRVAAPDADTASEVGRVGDAFNHMLNNVEGALAARHESETKVRQFVADASHELRNPLAAIRGYAELTRRHRDQVPPDAAFAMGRIEAESGRMSKLVEELLLLARLDSGPDLALAPTNLNELVLNAVSDAQVAGPAHDWGVDLPPAAVVVHADANQLHQVLVNLLANARKHTPEGTAVDTGVRALGGFAVVTVTDNGPGIAPDDLTHVFERFVRADQARAYTAETSTGLGLAIVAAVMEAHGGTASVESRPGRTVFTLRLPLA
ncbi:MAG TPA: HAMP domain-containing sensor histidine kinase [Propionibacteriaceae bacterium]|nr:HAMP domain-containing sensor histidine kinase [Propionibacteriaceae bacterium]